jgi:hypothetical protein
MKKYIIIAVSILIIFGLIIFGNLVFWGVAMQKAPTPEMTKAEIEFIESVENNYGLCFSFSHNFQAPLSIKKTLNPSIFLIAKDPKMVFDKWEKDSLTAFTDNINKRFQEVLNYKAAYASFTYTYEDYNGILLLDKEFQYPVK